MPKTNTPTTIMYVDKEKQRCYDDEIIIKASKPYIIIRYTNNPTLVNRIYME